MASGGRPWLAADPRPALARILAACCCCRARCCSPCWRACMASPGWGWGVVLGGRGLSPAGTLAGGGVWLLLGGGAGLSPCLCAAMGAGERACR